MNASLYCTSFVSFLNFTFSGLVNSPPLIPECVISICPILPLKPGILPEGYERFLLCLFITVVCVWIRLLNYWRCDKEFLYTLLLLDFLSITSWIVDVKALFGQFTSCFGHGDSYCIDLMHLFIINVQTLYHLLFYTLICLYVRLTCRRCIRV
jgi:hypothetical protein